MKLEVGKFYRTRDGRKAGPIKDYNGLWAGIVQDDPGSGRDGRLFYQDTGKHRFGEIQFDLVAEWEDEMKITMDGKYAYRKDPFTQVRILCVDRNNSAHPILSMAEDGRIEFHTSTGATPYHPDFDLVPLQEKLPDLWVNIYPHGSKYVHDSKASAEKGKVTSGGSDPGVKTIKYIPAPDQTS